jgi:glycosyltransferase involved in cell wall biosynthesis
MRIALISFHYSESTVVLAKYMAKRDILVDYYYVTKIGSSDAPGFDFGKRVYKLGLGKLSIKYLKNDRINQYYISLLGWSNKSFGIDSFIFKRVILKLLKFDYDIYNIIGHNKLLLDAYDFLPGNKVVHTLHEVRSHYLDQIIADDLLSFLINNRIRIIVHSENAYTSLISNLNVDSKRIKKIPFGCFESYSVIEENRIFSTTNTKFILWFGWVQKYKGLRALYEAVDMIQWSELGNVKIVVAGKGDDEFLEKMKSSDRFLVVNRFLRNSELVFLFRNCEFVVCPYTSGSQSGILTTAFQFGKPVICTNIATFKEFVINDSNALVIDPNSSRDLALAINKLLTDINYLDFLKRGVLNFDSYINWSSIVDETLNFYEMIHDDQFG